MKRKQRDGLVPIGEAFGGLGGPVKAIRESSPQAIHRTHCQELSGYGHLEVAPVHRLRCDAHGEVLDRPKANISPRRVFKDKMISLIEQQRETGAGLSLAAMCRVLEVSRAAYYRARATTRRRCGTRSSASLGEPSSGWEVLVRVLYESSPQAKNNSMRSCFHFLVDPPHFHKQIELCALLVAEIFMRSP